MPQPQESTPGSRGRHGHTCPPGGLLWATCATPGDCAGHWGERPRQGPWGGDRHRVAIPKGPAAPSFCLLTYGLGGTHPPAAGPPAPGFQPRRKHCPLQSALRSAPDSKGQALGFPEVSQPDVGEDPKRGEALVYTLTWVPPTTDMGPGDLVMFLLEFPYYNPTRQVLPAT